MNEKSYPLISVLCLNYNQKPYVQHALNTIKAQTYPNLELLISDDCSSDGSPEVIDAWLEEHGMQAQTFYHKENFGVCKTLNQLLAHSHGEWITILAADDYWEPHHLQTLADKAFSLPEDYAVIYSDSWQVDEHGQSLGKTFISDHRDPAGIPDGDVFLELADHNWICAISILIRKSCYDVTGVYDERLVYEDYDMWLRIAAHFKFYFVREVTASSRVLKSSITRQHLHVRSVRAEKSDFYIAWKLLKTGKLTPELQAKYAAQVGRIAKKLYRLKVQGRVPFMIRALQYNFSVKLLLKTVHSIVAFWQTEDVTTG